MFPTLYCHSLDRLVLTLAGYALSDSGKTCRLGILISGRGSNMSALADAIQSGRLPGTEISIVISDQPGGTGLLHAQQRGIKTITIERSGRKREEHDREIVAALHKHGVDLVCLAGYMRLLSRYFLDEYAGRILNIHPSLLPAFPGLDAQRQALEHGVKWAGCTVHLVDETLDGGPIIAQRIVAVRDDDTVETLSARILEQEHQLYAEAVGLIASGNYEVVGRRVVGKEKQVRTGSGSDRAVP